MHFHDLISVALDSLLLLGILVTAITAVFKFGRWSGKSETLLTELAKSFVGFRSDFDDHVSAFEDHVAEEDKRFGHVEKRIESMHVELKQVTANTNGRSRS
jgi:hypothetical protein